jgi:proline iminopeptidase
MRIIVGMLVCAVALGASPADARAKAAKPTVTAVEGHVPGADGVRLYYRKTGQGKPVVVFLHGGPGLNSKGYELDFEPLGVGRTLVMYDQRGGGRSDLVSEPERLTMEHHVRDLEALRRSFGFEKVALAGVSWGAGLAIHYAARHPEHVERLLLLSPMPPAGKPYTEERGAKFIEALGPERFDRLRALYNSYDTAPDEELPGICRELEDLYNFAYLKTEALRARAGRETCRVPADALRAQGKNGFVIQNSLGVWDFRPVLAQLKMPALVVDGADTNIPLDATRVWVKTLPNGRLYLVPSAGHLPAIEQPKAFFGPVVRFLNGEWPEEAPSERSSQ